MGVPVWHPTLIDIQTIGDVIISRRRRFSYICDDGALLSFDFGLIGRWPLTASIGEKRSRSRRAFWNSFVWNGGRRSSRWTAMSSIDVQLKTIFPLF